MGTDFAAAPLEEPPAARSSAESGANIASSAIAPADPKHRGQALGCLALADAPEIRPERHHVTAARLRNGKIGPSPGD